MSRFVLPGLLVLAGHLTAQVSVRIQPVPVDPPSFLRARVEGVDALTAANAWAAGWVQSYDRSRGGYVDETYVLHWDGSLWRRVASPSPPVCSTCKSTRSKLYAIDAVSPADVWAAGTFKARHPTSAFVGYQMLLLHYDGRTWKQIPPVYPKFGSPFQSSSGTTVEAVEAISAKDVWFFGFWSGDATIPRGALALHFDGSKFRFHRMPWAGNGYVSFYAADAAGPNEVWAAGKSAVLFRQGQETLVMRWNGSSWTRMHPPASASLQYRIDSVLVRSANDVWLAGYERKPSQPTTAVPYVVHWNGSRWLRTKPGGFIAGLVDAGGAVLAIGSDARIHRWTGSAWTQLTRLKNSQRFGILDASAAGAGDVFFAGHEGAGGVWPLVGRVEPLSRGTAAARFPCSGGPLARTLNASTLARLGRPLVVGAGDLEARNGFPAPNTVYWIVGTKAPSACGPVLPGFGFGGRGTELAVDPTAIAWLAGPATRRARGSPASFTLPVPNDSRLSGFKLATQALFFDRSLRPALSAGLELTIGR